MRETFKQARNRIMTHLESEGWQVRRYDRSTFKELKEPWALSPDGKLKLWFKPQAVHYTTEDEPNRKLSLWNDIRMLSNEAFVDQVRRLHTRLI